MSEPKNDELVTPEPQRTFQEAVRAVMKSPQTPEQLAKKAARIARAQAKKQKQQK